MPVCFPELKKCLGFGCMRLPMKGDEPDMEQFNEMVDCFLENGFNYFDTATVYLGGKSESALREGLSRRHPRESFVFTNKLSGSLFEKEEDIRPLLERQLEGCGLAYFDFYLMHAQSRRNYEKYQACHAYETALELKAEGKIRHMGISFHDDAETLEMILTDHPEIEVVQLQLNYMDYEDPKVQARRCLEVCRKYQKPVIVMEPVKGGRLSSLHPDAQAVLEGLHGGSAASYALRFAAGCEGVVMVLSGMSDMEQMEDNVRCMKDFAPLNERERKAVEQVTGILRALPLIPCTTCRYCVDGCPMGIPIPEIFSKVNAARLYHDGSAKREYAQLCTGEKGKASACVKCGACEQSCPQGLEIRALLEEAAGAFE